jgi:NAD(P)-dependent dehydrogenase (short-subunit alcohol dehydrogenase family)
MTIKNFDGAVAVITGGASGIGLATARALHARGAHVVLADINEQALQQAAQQVKESNPSSIKQIVVMKTDVTNEEQVRELMHLALDTCGRIDLVVSSAGIGRGGLVDMFSAQEMQTIMNINFMGIYHCVQAALPMMRQQQSGHFVFLSSAAGKIGVPLMTAYCATKWAVRGFSLALRAELYETGIDVTTVYPSWVDTPMTKQEGMEFLSVDIKLTAEQVAEGILQAVQEGRHDLTLAPDEGTAQILAIMKDDPDKAEQLMGQAFKQRMQEIFGSQA